ncbi:HlyIII-domain-containing protein [Aulographum hederae CBS 113979]|uniref:HlyIII-domain-containing protein n=1 Tax=Aulographum hederae CBS 113979 TaxID=1176131 RepID=A0A6G1H2N7_9PEZI|nr:HlyIII-domain-containing protein [Aulographum hederae CBS 113979]
MSTSTSTKKDDFPKSSPLTDLKTAATTLEQKAEEKLTFLYHEIEHWQQDNHYILSGYRPASNSYAGSVRSIAGVHNESVNIWTHLFGFLYLPFPASPYSSSHSSFPSSLLSPSSPSSTTSLDLLAFSAFFAGAATCLGLSAAFHTLSNHSAAVQKWGNQLDYLGIVALIWGSFVASIRFGFREDEVLMRRYWGMITALAICTGTFTITPRFRHPTYRPIRATMFVLLGLSAVVPVFHGMSLYGVEKLDQLMALKWVVLQGAFYILGAGLYAARVPERFSPGRFDIWGSSHQIFHVLVLLAAAAHFTGLVKAFERKHGKTDKSS